MIVGINRYYDHEGTRYHLQCEDLGEESACYEIRVCREGTVIWQKRFPYQDLLDQELTRPAQEQSLRGRMEKTVFTVEAAISKGKIP